MPTPIFTPDILPGTAEPLPLQFYYAKPHVQYALTDDPSSGELDIPALLTGQPYYWKQLQLDQGEMVRKTLILIDPYIVVENRLADAEQQLRNLLACAFNIWIWQGAEIGLKQFTMRDFLDFEATAKRITPISEKDIAPYLVTHHMAIDHSLCLDYTLFSNPNEYANELLLLWSRCKQHPHITHLLPYAQSATILRIDSLITRDDLTRLHSLLSGLPLLSELHIGNHGSNPDSQRSLGYLHTAVTQYAAHLTVQIEAGPATDTLAVQPFHYWPDLQPNHPAHVVWLGASIPTPLSDLVIPNLLWKHITLNTVDLTPATYAVLQPYLIHVQQCRIVCHNLSDVFDLLPYLPHLSHLIIHDCHPSPKEPSVSATLSSTPCLHLTHLTLFSSEATIHTDTLWSLLSCGPHLQKLTIEANSIALPITIPPLQLKQLTDLNLCVTLPLSYGVLATFQAIAPSLIHLLLDLSELPVETALPNAPSPWLSVQNLTLIMRDSHDDQWSGLRTCLQTLPALQNCMLLMQSYSPLIPTGRLHILPAACFQTVRRLSAETSDLFALKRLLGTNQTITTLDVGLMTPQDVLLLLQQYPSLQHVHIDVAVLDTECPQTVYITAPRLCTWTLRSINPSDAPYAHQHIWPLWQRFLSSWPLSIPSSSTGASVPSSSTSPQTMDTDTAAQQTTYTVHQIFTTCETDQPIPPTHYRCCVNDLVDVTGEEIMLRAHPGPLRDITPAFHHLASDTVQRRKAQYHQPNHYAGILSLAVSTEPTLLPSLQADEQLQWICFEASPDDGIRIGYSDKHHGYYVSAKQAMTVNVLWFVHLPHGRQLPLKGDEIGNGKLLRLQAKYKKFGGLAIDTTQARTALDKITLLMSRQQGACRHRAVACWYEIQQQNLGIPARIVHNDLHMWLEVWLNGQWRIFDLGGHRAHVTVLPPAPGKAIAQASTIPPTPETVPSLTRQEIIASSADPDPTLPRQHTLFQAPTAPIDYTARESICTPRPSSAPTGHLLPQAGEGNNEFAWVYIQQCFQPTVTNKLLQFEITAARYAFLTACQWVSTRERYLLFVVHEPHALRCAIKTLRLATDSTIGIIQPAPASDLWYFLQTVRETTRPSMLVINWERFSPTDVVQCQTILDTRQLDGYALPDHLVILSLDEVALRGDDFYSRHATQQTCPYDATTLQAIYAPDLRVLRDAARTEQIMHVDLYHTQDWETRLLGQWILQGHHFHFQPGALVSALHNKLTMIVLKHTRQDDRLFEQFWAQLLLTRRFFVFGRTYTIPDDLVLMRAEDNCPYPFTTWTAEVTTYHAHPDQRTADMPVLNPSTLSQAFARYTIIQQQLYHQPGYLIPHSHQTFYISHALSNDQWAQLLETAYTQQVSLSLLLAPGVTAPPTVSVQPLPSTASRAAPTGAGEIWLTTERDTLVHELHRTYPNAPVIPITGATLADYFYRITPTWSDADQQFYFTENEGLIWQALQRGETVIFHGQLEPSTLQQYASLFFPEGSFNGKPFAGRLIWVTDQAYGDIQGLSYIHAKPTPPLMTLPFDVAKGRTLLTQSQSTTLTPVAEREAWHQGPHIVENIHHTRVQAILTSLDQFPMITLVGPTGAGKSTLVTHILPQYGVRIQDDFETWLTTQDTSERQCLFIDEINLQHSVTHVLESLQGLMLEPSHPVIWWKGKCYRLTSQHKVIFAQNPNDMGDNRTLPDLLFSYPHVIPLTALPEAYIYYALIHPIMSDAPTIGRLFLQAFRIWCQDDQADISVRHLQMLALTWCAQNPTAQQAYRTALNSIVDRAQACLSVPAYTKFTNTWLAHHGYQPTPPTTETLVLPTFLITPSRMPLYETLERYFAVRTLRTSGAHLRHRFPGLGGLFLEGPPGIGKTEFVRHYLAHRYFTYVPCHTVAEANHTCFTTFPLRAPLAEQRAFLMMAAHKGLVVMIDELNTLPHIEACLNALLMGVDPETNQPIHAGFTVIGTQNTIAHRGREPLSSALLGRLERCQVNAYPPAECEMILQHQYQLTHTEAHHIVTAILAQGGTFRDMVQATQLRDRNAESISKGRR